MDQDARKNSSRSVSQRELNRIPAFPSSNFQDALLGKKSDRSGSKSFMIGSDRGSMKPPEELRVLAKEFQGDGDNLKNSGSFRKGVPTLNPKGESSSFFMGMNRERLQSSTMRKRAWEDFDVSERTTTVREDNEEDEDLFDSNEDPTNQIFKLMQSTDLSNSPQSPRNPRILSRSGSPGGSPNTSKRDLWDGKNELEDAIHKTLRSVEKTHSEKYMAQKESLRKVMGTSSSEISRSRIPSTVKHTSSIFTDTSHLPHLFVTRNNPWVRASPSKNSGDRKNFPRNSFGTAVGLSRSKKNSDGEKSLDKVEMHKSAISTMLRASTDFKRSSRDEGEMDGVKFKGKIQHKINSINKKLEITFQEIKDIQSKRLKLYVRGRGKTERYKSYGPRAAELLKSFRAVIQTKFVMMETEQNIELLKATALQERFSLLSDIYSALAAVRNEVFTVTPSNRKILESTHKHLQRDPDIKAQIKVLKKIRTQLKNQVAVYKRYDKAHYDIGSYINTLNDIRDENVVVTPGGQYYEERAAPIRPGKLGGISCWSFIQRRFDCFLLDQRSREGKHIQKFLNELKLEYPYVIGELKRDDFGVNGGIEPIHPNDISDFPRFLAEALLTRHKIPRYVSQNEEDLGQIFNNNELKMEIGIQRCIFPLIHDFCFAYSVNNAENFERVQDDSKKYLKNQSVLKTLPFVDCPIEFGFLPRGWDKPLIELPEVEDALGELNGMVYQLTPIDMIFAIQKVLTQIVRIIKSIAQDKDKDVGADDIFPLFLYILLFSCIGTHTFKSINGPIEITIWHYVQFMNDFLTDNELRGEAGYCFVTLQAALRHITDIEIEFEEGINNE
eukprot:TRINITY_DN2751_c1_g2_i1.p1 TRINITY_DN2751_c1_g2~~TRINITY_DN2751_c1_g2_i1.p1  ORF type:complete len:838 (+),score=216.71 TRINITY_DN2751_c1_g2_i1:155-2668(+)